MPPTESGSSPERGARIITRRQALSALASEQYGVVSRQDLLAIGMSSTAIGALVADGTLHRKAHALYAVGHRHLTREGWWSLAVRCGGDGTLLSHRAATAVRGLLRPVDRTDIIVPGQRGMAIPGIRPHRSTIDPADRDAVHGLPVTGLARTMLDIAADDPRRLVEALEQSLILRVYDHREMLAVLDRYQGARGTARLRAAIAVLPDDPARFRSRSERRAQDLIVSAGLPQPRVNDWFVTGAGGGHELDLYWPRLRKNIEIDGPRHDLPWQQAADRRRDADLRAHGIAIQRHRVELLDRRRRQFVAAVSAFLAE